jgi:hypothetical protein
MFESTQWTLEEPEVNDQTKYDLMMPTVVKSSHPEQVSHTRLGVALRVLRLCSHSSLEEICGQHIEFFSCYWPAEVV